MPKRKLILEAAQYVFGQHGYSATTLKMVAERAGVAFGLVSHYFGSKQELFITAGFAMVDAVMDHVEAAVRDAPSGLEAVEIYVESYLAFTLEHRATFPILVRCSPFTDVELPGERKRIADKFRERIVGALQVLLERGMADGSIMPLPPEETAFLVYGNIIGVVRTTLITPYCVPNLYAETVRYVRRSLAAKAHAACLPSRKQLVEL